MTARIRTYPQPTSGHTAEIEARRAKRARRAAKRARDAEACARGQEWADANLRARAIAGTLRGGTRQRNATMVPSMAGGGSGGMGSSRGGTSA